jgi:hypothetical protein
MYDVLLLSGCKTSITIITLNVTRHCTSVLTTLTRKIDVKNRLSNICMLLRISFAAKVQRTEGHLSRENKV